MHIPSRPAFSRAVLAAFLLAGTPLLFSQDPAPAKNDNPAQKPAAEPAAPAPKPLTEAERATSEALIEFQEKEQRADELFRIATVEYQKGNYQDTIKYCLSANKILRDAKAPEQMTEPDQKKLESIKSLIGKAYYYRALELFYKAEQTADAGNYDEAVKLSQDAIENYPLCRDIMEQMIKKYQKLKDATEYNSKLSYDVIDPRAEDRNMKIEREMQKGQNFYRTKQWAKARDHFNAVIREDPYNERAIDYLKRCYEHLTAAAKMRHAVKDLEYYAETGFASVAPVFAVNDSVEEQVDLGNQEKIDKTKNIESKLNKIVIPSLELETRTIQEAVEELRKLSKEKDPDQKGINIVLLVSKAAPDAASTEESGDESESYDEDSESSDEETDDSSADAESADAESADAESEEAAPPANATHMIEFLKLNNVTLRHAIELVCEAANVRYRVEPHAVLIADDKVPLDDYDLKVFVVEKEALDEILGGGGEEGAASADTTDAQQNTLKKFFVDRGVPFPAGTAIRFDQAVSRLIVTNTQEALSQIDQIIQERNYKDPQVLVQVKFVEVSLNDVEELGFEYQVSRTTDGTHSLIPTDNEIVQAGTYVANNSFTLVYRPQFSNSNTTVLGNVTVVNATNANNLGNSVVIENGTQYTIPVEKDAEGNVINSYYRQPLNATSIFGSSVTFGPNSQLVRNAQTDSSAFSNNRYISNDTVMSWSHSSKEGYDVSSKLHALDLADSTDVLSAPRITTMNGQPAVIKMVTEKYYPDEWSDAEVESVSSNSNGSNTYCLTPSIPTFGDAIEEGLVLNVTPEVEEMFTITLNMTPVIQEFIGWTDYSYDLPLSVGNDTKYFPNTLKMPIIEARTVETTVVSFDGETIVLGGVIKDRIMIVDDQYPILGDIPLVGRLFQSKGRGSEKTDLLIFLTSRLIKPDGSPIRENEERGVPAFY